jgi:hypothetical protein
MQACLPPGGLRDAQGLVREADLGLVRRVVQADEQRAALHLVAFAVRDLHDAAADLGRELRAPARSHRARLGVGDGGLDARAFHRNDADPDGGGSEHGRPHREGYDDDGDEGPGPDQPLRHGYFSRALKRPRAILLARARSRRKPNPLATQSSWRIPSGVLITWGESTSRRLRSAAARSGSRRPIKAIRESL